MLIHLRPAITLLLLLTLLTGIGYPLAMTAIAQGLFPSTANGSLVTTNGVVIGSSLIGQNWKSDRYFRGRPSAAGSGYDAKASSGSNLGPTSAKLMDRIRESTAQLQAEGATTIPGDAVTASASGLDPHISPAFAAVQIPRVANARGLDAVAVQAAVDAATERPLGPFGEPRVNVLLLNMALDRLSSPGNG